MAYPKTAWKDFLQVMGNKLLIVRQAENDEH